MFLILKRMPEKRLQIFQNGNVKQTHFWYVIFIDSFFSANGTLVVDPSWRRPGERLQPVVINRPLPLPKQYPQHVRYILSLERWSETNRQFELNRTIENITFPLHIFIRPGFYHALVISVDRSGMRHRIASQALRFAYNGELLSQYWFVMFSSLDLQNGLRYAF